MSVSDGRRIEVHPGREAIVTFDPDRTFECVDSCSWCCHHGVLLYEDDFTSLAAYADLEETTKTFRGHPFIVKEEKDRADHVGDDHAACMFLDGNGKCTLELEHEWKPTRCSIFPLAVERVDDEIVVSVRETAERHCEGMDVSERRLIDHLDAFLPPLLWELPEPETEIRL